MATKVKCDNCGSDASYTNADPGVNPVNYCHDCLPSWLRDRAAAGHFPLVEKLDAPKPSKKAAEPTTTDVAPADAGN